MASTISTSGIASGSVIKAEHALRIIDSLSGTANNDIYVYLHMLLQVLNIGIILKDGKLL